MAFQQNVDKLETLKKSLIQKNTSGEVIKRMGELLDVARVMVQPTMKLLDMCGNAIGSVYEPRHKRKMAEATAYEISVVGEAMRNAADMPIVYNQDGVAINSEDFNRLMQRAGTRLVLQETIKQHNIESVIDHAYGILEKEECCSAEPVEQGWVNRFFDSVADVSDEDLQKLWGRILAGETAQPRSYSLRTLETLKNISKYEAEMFMKISPYIVNTGSRLFLPSDTELLQKYGIMYGEIINLDECGLINSSGLVFLTLTVSNTKDISLHNCSRLVLLRGIGEDEGGISIGAFSLTQAGKELFGVLNCKSNKEYICELAEKIVKNNSKKVNATVYQINSIETDYINYDTTILCEYPAKSAEVAE